MPAKITLISGFAHRLSAASRRVKIASLAAILLLAAVSAFVLHAAGSANGNATSTNALSPALKLAQGTLNLENTDLAVDAGSAAKLLPLWQLMEELSSSSSAAPEEISAVVEEIQLNMSAAQIQAIESMEFTQAPVGAPPAGSAPAAQAASADAGPMLGDMPAGDAPPDGGGMPPAGGFQSTTSTTGASNARSSPAVIQQLIRLLEAKVQS